MVQHMNTPALKKQWVLDAQWTDCPENIEAIIEHLWRYHELGNDNYMLRRSVNDFLEMAGIIDEGQDESVVEIEVEQWLWGDTEEEQKGWVKAPVNLKPLIDFIRSAGIPDDEAVIIHWWW